MPICLSIAGFDPSGGAGIQADLKTFCALGCYGMTILTALPIQNTQGVQRIFALPPESITAQLEVVFADIIPDAIKIGLLFDAEIIRRVATFLRVNAVDIPIVLDPVLCAKSGDLLLQEDAMQLLRDGLFPLVSLVTPNLPEAEALTGMSVHDAASMFAAGSALLQGGARAVLIKGGHLVSRDSIDLLFSPAVTELRAPRIATENTHGTGCTLSAAIAAHLATKVDLITACQRAKHYTTLAIQGAQHEKIGKGKGPVAHFHSLWADSNCV